MPRRRKLLTTDDAKPTSRQHRRPCSDCPLRRDAVPGWLGSLSNHPEAYARLLHSDAQVMCHTKIGPQCAGVAVYRANVHKSPRDPAALVLPADKEAVFATPAEFIQHHTREGK